MHYYLHTTYACIFNIHIHIFHSVSSGNRPLACKLALNYFLLYTFKCNIIIIAIIMSWLPPLCIFFKYISMYILIMWGNVTENTLHNGKICPNVELHDIQQKDNLFRYYISFISKHNIVPNSKLFFTDSSLQHKLSVL